MQVHSLSDEMLDLLSGQELIF